MNSKEKDNANKKINDNNNNELGSTSNSMSDDLSIKEIKDRIKVLNNEIEMLRKEQQDLMKLSSFQKSNFRGK